MFIIPLFYIVSQFFYCLWDKRIWKISRRLCLRFKLTFSLFIFRIQYSASNRHSESKLLYIGKKLQVFRFHTLYILLLIDILYPLYTIYFLYTSCWLTKTLLGDNIIIKFVIKLYINFSIFKVFSFNIELKFWICSIY